MGRVMILPCSVVDRAHIQVQSPLRSCLEAILLLVAVILWICHDGKSPSALPSYGIEGSMAERLLLACSVLLLPICIHFASILHSVQLLPVCFLLLVAYFVVEIAYSDDQASHAYFQ